MDDIKLKDNKGIIIRGCMFVFGIFLIALDYNMFFLENDFVVGGASGLAIVIEGLTGFNANLFIYIIAFILIICSYIFLGMKETKNTILGSLLYPLFITFTMPISSVIGPYFQFEEVLVRVVLAGLLFGIGSGIIYKCGFNTGGIDVLVKIANKYFHVKESKSILVINIIIILFGGFVFGMDKVIYAIIIIVISSILIDKILIGISDSKMFLIYTKKTEQVSKILESFKTGYTLLPTEGGYSHKKGMLIMCVLGNKDYVKFKEVILEIDPHAFFVINDCYEVNGGVKRSSLPFI